MIFLSAQPCDIYFLWQVEVQIVNFRKHGISDKMHILVWHPKEEEMITRDKKGIEVARFKRMPDLTGWKVLQEKYPEVKIILYPDEGVDLTLYISQLRPHILSRHFDVYPELKDEVIFYHDSDIIFNYLPDFQKLIEGDINWQSDTSGYLDYNYLRDIEKKGNIPEDEAIGVLCQIGNISLETLKSYTGRTGGAQYILREVDGDFWRDVERQCLEIRLAFTHVSSPDVQKTSLNKQRLANSINTKYFVHEHAGFQSWCADMWAVNMALWSRNKVTDTTKELDFSWGSDNRETYLKKPIYHNAGVTGPNNGQFYKAKWRDKSPIGLVHPVNKNSASYFYVQAINSVK